ncbi:MAG: hypothetical protein ACFE9Q_10720 [Candidatus Hodarchaeota archaeon]
MPYDRSKEPVKCRKCGTKTIIYRYEQDFCSNCGMELDYTALKKRGNASRNLIIIFIIAIGLLFLILAFFPKIFCFIIGLITIIGVALIVLILFWVYLQMKGL